MRERETMESLVQATPRHFVGRTASLTWERTRFEGGTLAVNCIRNRTKENSEYLEHRIVKKHPLFRLQSDVCRTELVIPTAVLNNHTVPTYTMQCNAINGATI